MKSTLAEKLLYTPFTLVRATKCTCMHVDLCCIYYIGMSMAIQTKHRLDTQKYKSSSYYRHFVSILI